MQQDMRMHTQIDNLNINIKVADLVHLPLTVAALNAMNFGGIDDITINIEIISEPIPTGATQEQVDAFGARVQKMVTDIQTFDATLNVNNPKEQ